MTFMPSTRPILALSWLLAINLAAQELPPSNSLSEEPSKPAITEQESRLVQLEPLLVQFDSGFVFFGLQTSPASTNVIIEYSQDLKSWREDVPMMCLNAPPPPPIALIDRLGRAPGRNLRIIPLDSRGSNEGFCRSKVMTVTNVAPLGSVTADRAVSVKP